MASPTEQALVTEACRASSLLWVRPADDAGARPIAVWHVVSDGAVHLVGGGLEQDLSSLAEGAVVEVTARSKDSGGRLVRFLAEVHDVRLEDDAWDAVVADLHAKRLNPPDGEEQPARWARESRVVRLDPTGRVLEHPGHVSHRSGAAEPPDSPATTVGPLPFVLGRRARRR